MTTVVTAHQPVVAPTEQGAIVRSCVECGSSQIEDGGPCRKFDRGATPIEIELMQTRSAGRLYWCRECGLAFRHPILDRQAIEQVYASYATPDWDYQRVEERVAWRLAAEHIRERASGEVTVLDVGAYFGQFLEMLPANCRRYAIEPSEQAADRLRSVGVEVVGRFLEQPLSSETTFDFVTLFDVFEHLEEPGQSMERLWSLVSPGGSLVISTGNCKHWTWRLLRGTHWYLEPVLHLRFLSEQYVQRFARSHNADATVARIPHTHGSPQVRFTQTLITWFFALKGRGGLVSRGLARLLAMSSQVKRTGGKTYPPYTMSLADHLFVVISKPAK
jgi:2-polyprenyl-3-methyl-5-hydroxy-6-metoxy-1,4-benzoquinol methylase